MLSYRDHNWVLLHGSSHFSAFIASHHRHPAEVLWEWSLAYAAGGPQWRRVTVYDRPCVKAKVSSFDLAGWKWSSLAETSHWHEGPARDAHAQPQGGKLKLSYRDQVGDGLEIISGAACDWRVVEREGSRFMVELAVEDLGADMPPPMSGSEALVLADGQELVAAAAAEAQTSGLRQQVASVHAMEWIPFGLVTVMVPRNARDPLGFAHGRARHLLGINEMPEHVGITDFNEVPGAPEETRHELVVDLHFHGIYS